MGEAKRRKQLGLMPTVYPFEADLTDDGHVTLVRAPDDKALQRTLTEALEKTQLTGDAWASEYRTALVLSGRVPGVLHTAEQVADIPVPPLRRVSGEIVMGKTLTDVEGVAIAFDGGVIRLRQQKHSVDGQKWESFPAIRDVQRLMDLLVTHPAFELQGELLGQFRVEQYAEGRIDVEPDPPEGTLEALEDVAREWHGATPEEWVELHQEMMSDRADDSGEVPLMRRTFFELRQPAPLQNPTRSVFTTRRNVEVYPLVGATYSIDGETWLSYDDPEAEPQEDDLMSAFANILNMETVQVTVKADGSVEWEDGEIDAEDAGRVRADLQAATGAGTPEQWAAWTRKMLLDTFNADEDEAEADIPVPVAVRLDVPKDAISNPDPLAQTFIESEVTFDGEHWRDLYDEEVPQELLLALAQFKPAE
ncbi:hypothetical protein [Deinococcus sp.]|uniref:hypothetical protein n=1 Tax=Deinococcus sp. TaxID=47478 RepID=UPI0025C361CD|nr:hypothetical protein [Deinococcus sp.]